MNLELPPYEFEKRCRHHIPANDSVAILGRLGYRLPSRLLDLGALTQALVQSPRMLSEDIDRYVELCQQRPEGG